MPGSPVRIAGNQLVVVVAIAPPRSRAVHALAADGIRRIAIGDPAAVPAGVYAKGYLERLGLWERLSPKIVPVTNVRAALTAVENGSADAALVYETDARVTPCLRLAVVISGPESPRIVYSAGVVKNVAPRRRLPPFRPFLRGPVALRIFEHHGFVAPALSRRAAALHGRLAHHLVHASSPRSPRPLLMLPPGLAAGVAARARPFQGTPAARDAGVAAARDAAGRHRVGPADAGRAARAARAAPRRARHRGRVHLESGGPGDGGDGAAAAGAHRRGPASSRSIGATKRQPPTLGAAPLARLLHRSRCRWRGPPSSPAPCSASPARSASSARP